MIMSSVEYYTPPEIVAALGEFDLDPCSPVKRLFDTANRHFTIEDDGLKQDWFGRVWLNPPYGRDCLKTWVKKMSEHKSGIALIVPATGAEGFHRYVFERAHSILFYENRISFIQPNGKKQKGNRFNSCFVSYSEFDTEAIRTSGLKGKLLTIGE